MNVIRPLTIDDLKLTSTNVLENDYAAYSSTATYSAGARVTVAEVHRNYECIANNVSGIYPPDDETKWLDLGATNAWAMFDAKVGTQTVNQDSISVTITPGQIVNSLGVVNVSANSITVTVNDPVEGIVYNRAESLIDTSAVDWYAYFFAPFVPKPAIAFTDLPAYRNATIEITLEHTGESVKCGVLIVGNRTSLGDAQYGLKLGIQDYSRKETDTFGNWTVIERGYGDVADFDVQIPSGQVAFVHSVLADLRATPALYVGNDGMPETHVFGFYRDFQINLATPVISTATISIEGLT